MNINQWTILGAIFTIAIVGLSLIFTDMADRGLNLNEEELEKAREISGISSQQRENYNENSGLEGQEYSFYNDGKEESTETGFNLDYMTSFLNIGSLFAGIPILLMSLFPFVNTAFTAWVVGIIMALLGGAIIFSIAKAIVAKYF